VTSGPFKKDGKASYLANYRYSTLGLLNAAGLEIADGIPVYQDLTYKLHLPTKNAGMFSVFGLVGKGDMKIDDTAKENEDLTVFKGEFNYISGISGINHLYFFNDKTSIKSSLSFSGKTSTNKGFELGPNQVDFRLQGISIIDNYAIQFQTAVNKKINAKHTVTTGVFIDQLYYNMDISGYEVSVDGQRTFIAGDGNTTSSRVYANWNYDPHPNWKIVTGLHYSLFHLNNQQAIDPRLGINWKFTDQQKLSIGYGKHSRRENLSTYLVEIPQADGTTSAINEKVDFQKAHHFVLGHEVSYATTSEL